MRHSVVSYDDDVAHWLVKVKQGKDIGPNLVCHVLQTFFLSNSISGSCAHANGSKLCCTYGAVQCLAVCWRTRFVTQLTETDEDINGGDGRQTKRRCTKVLACARRPVCNLNLSSRPGFLTSLVTVMFRSLQGTARKTAMHTITAGACGSRSARDHKCATMHNIVVTTGRAGLPCAKF